MTLDKTLTSRHFMNESENLVLQSLRGVAMTRPDLEVNFQHQFVYQKKRKDQENSTSKDQVALVSGGGSGHEPAHIGYVGKGMLTAAVCGNVYASPTATQVYECIKAVSSKAGVLLIVKNYTGDRWQFGRALERAKQDGLQVEMVIVDDDHALPRNSSKAGKRGLAGTVLVHKILGAAADLNYSLTQLHDLATKLLIPRLGTLGISLSACNIPGTFREKDVEKTMNFGLGIHGEPGVKKEPLLKAHHIAKMIINHFVSDPHGYFTNFNPLKNGVLLINNLGSTTPLELYLFAGEIVNAARAVGISIDRVLVGNFMSALDMHGISVTLLNLSGLAGDEKLNILSLLDGPTKAFGWTWNLQGQPPVLIDNMIDIAEKVSTLPQQQDQQQPSSTSKDVETIQRLVSGTCNHLISLTDYLNELDSKVGDGDTGSTVRSGSLALLSWLDNRQNFNLTASQAFQEMALALETKMGGSSGAFFCLVFESISRAYAVSTSSNQNTTRQIWALGLGQGVEAVSKYGGAQVGDRTLLDALVPAINLLQKEPLSTIQEMRDAAKEGAEFTALMSKAGAGRSSYVSSKELEGNPDPGAIVILEILNYLAASL